MSHRVTTETEIKDKALLMQACKTAGITFADHGNDHVRFTSGKLSNAVLDLRTGRITGDTDYGHTESGLGVLRQAYGEAKYKDECHRQGISIESRTVDKNGDIILMCSMG
jgi:hypothetical protein